MNAPIGFFSKRRRQRALTPANTRIYAIGDIHGRADLLQHLTDRISYDASLRPRVNEILIILGDFIDRGPGSASVIKALYAHRLSKQLVVLMGNHEAALVSAYNGDMNALKFWIEFGGEATLIDFGACRSNIRMANEYSILDLLHEHIPSDIIDWMSRLPVYYQSGDYVFVHAGIRPGIPLRRQKKSDLLWIRKDFLDDETDHGAVVVHGHTPSRTVVVKPNRIGVDTDAYQSDILSALVLQDERRWILDTSFDSETPSRSTGMELTLDRME